MAAPELVRGTVEWATTRAVVFAYHDVGVRCLKSLLSGGVEVPLVVTVKDDPSETAVVCERRRHGSRLWARPSLRRMTPTRLS